jgi:putative two-component system response regulator
MIHHPLGPSVRLVAALTALRDMDTGKHQGRVAKYVRVLADGLGLDEEHAATIELLSGVHDIGKLGISDAVLRKPGKLTSSEMDEIRNHVTIGLDAIDQHITDIGVSDHQFTPTLRAIIRSHHERWDGKGYPDRLRAEAIPFEARIVCLADQWDALTEMRVYRPVWSHGRARAFIVRSSGKRFDPAVVKAFLREYPRILDLYRTFRSDQEGNLRVD